jgi:diguanylate cyclase (GGDEF)-like protein
MDSLQKTQRHFLLFCLLAQQLIAVSCAIYFSSQEQSTEAIFYIALLSAISCSLTIFCIFKRYQLATFLFLGSLAGGMLFLLVASNHQISALWCVLTLPTFAMLLGRYSSLMIITGLYSIAVIILISGLSNSALTAYDGTLIMRFLFSYGLLASISMVIENKRFALLRQDDPDDKNLTTQDFLTQLPSRYFLEEKLEYWFQKFTVENRNFSIILADLDHCKSINDFHGRAIGDLALKKMGRLLTQELRREDIAARWSGNQLIILLPNVAQDIASTIAERLRKKASETNLESNGAKIKLTLSLGVTSMARSSDLDNLLSSAENCVCQAKQMGRNLVISA